MGLLCALLCEICDAGRVVLERLNDIGSHKHFSIWLMALRFITGTYELLPLTAMLSEA